jgi:hypothetical protein
MPPPEMLKNYFSSPSVLGSLFLRLFDCVFLNVWLTFAALRIFSLAASHPQEATNTRS